MATMVLDELNSFVWKFSHLWATGSNATLVLETHAGEACASLRLGLGVHPFRYQQNYIVKKKETPAKRRRREKRAAEAKSIDKVAKGSQESKLVDIGNVVSDLSRPLDNETSFIGDIDDGKREVCVTTNFGSNEEFDMYTFNYWDDTRGTVLEAIRNVEDKLDGSFLKCKIKESDRKYEVCEAIKLPDQDIHVKIKLKKKMKAVALGIQTAYRENKAAEVS